ncbi:MAG: hypothetical protein EOP51_12175 [Sphingobacteriales bacterium]|nr:MAG: hypothetical protein EOP51_12175 [Sphingobacteriales bacterium]
MNLKRIPSLIALSLISTLAMAQTADSTSVAPRHKELSAVTIVAHNGKRQLATTQMGKVELPVSMLLKAPSIGGEADVVKALQLTPGIKKGTEAGIGMYVRGGGNDENLIMLDGATVYNAGHMLGFFSVFNPNSLKDVQMYKSCFPSQYGGRLSSVMDVRTKEASLTDYKANISLGMITSSFSVEAPLIKDKLSVAVSGRRTYIDKVFNYVPYHFSDINVKALYVVDPSNRIYLSTYASSDVLKMSSLGQKDTVSEAQQVKTGMKLNNQTMSLRWNHMPQSGKYATDFTVLHTKFKYNVNGSMGGNNIAMQSAIQDFGVKGDLRTFASDRHKLSTGFAITYHYFNPNIVSSEGLLLDKFKNSDGQKIYNTEAAVYVNDDYKLNERWQANVGFRLSGDAVKDKTYINAEPRLGLRYMVNEHSAVKVSYARMAQYLHLVSSSALVLPTDIWYPVTASVKPGMSDQVSAGYSYNIASVGVNLSAEVYYKWLHNLVEYREGALLILNNNYEKELVKGKGRSYGLELFASKTTGKFTGWVGYSLSYAKRQFDSLNKGKEYFARYDRRHDLSLVGMYDISKHWGISSTAIYSTGGPFTGQKGQYLVPKPDFTGFDVMPSYTGRNELRLSDAFRVDMDLAYKFKIGTRIHADAHLSVYNLFNRTQPSNVQRVWDDKTSTFKYQQRGLFGTITAAAINLNF